MTNYPCPACERVFSRRSSLRNHVKTHENIVDRVLREISDDTRQEDAGEQQLGQEENPVFSGEQREDDAQELIGDEQREEEEEEEEEQEEEQEEQEEEQEFEEEEEEFEEEEEELEEEEEEEFEEEEEEEQEFEKEDTSPSLDGEKQEAVIISYLSYLIYTS